jgi:hypothetical protein
MILLARARTHSGTSRCFAPLGGKFLEGLSLLWLLVHHNLLLLLLLNKAQKANDRRSDALSTNRDLSTFPKEHREQPRKEQLHRQPDYQRPRAN